MISLSADQIEQKLMQLPLLGDCSRATLARAIPYLEEIFLKPGDVLLQEGEAAKKLFVIMVGQCYQHFPAGPVTVDDIVGEEALMGTPRYLAGVTAASESIVMMFPHEVVASLLREDHGLQPAASRRLLQKHGCAVETVGTPADARRNKWVEPLGWLTTLALPILVLLFGENLGLGQNAQLFLAILSVTLVMWMFRLVPEYVPGLFVVAATLGLGLAPVNVVLSGFASDAFFLTMSVLGVGAVIISSGLSYRFLLWLLRIFPSNQFGYNLSIAATGLLTTPVVPSIYGRAALITPLMNDMLQGLRLKKGGRAATALAASTFSGFTLMSSVFLTSKAPNFLILAMMPSQIQSQFQMVDWFIAASVTGAMMLALYFATALLFFRNPERPSLTRSQIQGQLDLLGPMHPREWAALVTILLFSLGVITFSMHQIPPSWIGLGLMCFLLAMRYLNAEEFRTRIDWPFLVFFGSIIGLINSMNYLGLDKLLTTHLLWIGEYMVKDFPVFLALLIGAMLVVRIVMPIAPSTIIFATIFISLADAAGLNPWVVGFAVLTLGELWIMPYQCHYYVEFEKLAGKGSFDQSLMLKHNIAISLIKIAALYASIPYWHYLRIL